MSSNKIIVAKSDIPDLKLFESSYFEICRTTKIGDGEFVNFTPDELCLLTLASIDIETLTDRCLMNKKRLSKKLMGLACQIDPDIDYVNSTNALADPLIYRLLKQKIKMIDNYDFSVVCGYLMNTMDNYTVKSTHPYKWLKIVDKTNINCLIWCCKNRQAIALIMFMLLNNQAYGCNIGQISNDGYTALMWACRKGLSGVAYRMIESCGSDCKPHVVNEDGHTALTYALLNASYCGMTNVIIKMIDTFGISCNPSIVTKDGHTALMYACKYIMSSFGIKVTEIIIKMIDKYGIKCNPGAVSNIGHTALMYACLYNLSSAAIKIIDTFGPDCNIGHVDNNGNSALSIARTANMQSVIDRLTDEKYRDIVKDDT